MCCTHNFIIFKILTNIKKCVRKYVINTLLANNTLEKFLMDPANSVFGLAGKTQKSHKIRENLEATMSCFA